MTEPAYPEPWRAKVEAEVAGYREDERFWWRQLYQGALIANGAGLLGTLNAAAALVQKSSIAGVAWLFEVVGLLFLLGVVAAIMAQSYHLKYASEMKQLYDRLLAGEVGESSPRTAEAIKSLSASGRWVRRSGYIFLLALAAAAVSLGQIDRALYQALPKHQLTSSESSPPSLGGGVASAVTAAAQRPRRSARDDAGDA